VHEARGPIARGGLQRAQAPAVRLAAAGARWDARVARGQGRSRRGRQLTIRPGWHSGCEPQQGGGPVVGRKKRADPKVTVQFSNYSNIFKRLELIRSKGVLPEFEKNK
jgi:hypothetical protein